MVDVELRSHFMSSAGEPYLTKVYAVQDVIRLLKVSKAPGPIVIPNRAVTHLPQRSLSLLAQIFNTIHLTHHVSTIRKHARLTSTTKPGKDPELPSSYWPIIMLDKIGEIFANILLARILHEISDRGLLRDKHFRF
jgi:hypothetical protein